MFNTVLLSSTEQDRAWVPNLFASASSHWYKCTQEITDLMPLASPRLGNPWDGAFEDQNVLVFVKKFTF